MPDNQRRQGDKRNVYQDVGRSDDVPEENLHLNQLTVVNKSIGHTCGTEAFVVDRTPWM